MDGLAEYASDDSTDAIPFASAQHVAVLEKHAAGPAVSSKQLPTRSSDSDDSAAVTEEEEGTDADIANPVAKRASAADGTVNAVLQTDWEAPALSLHSTSPFQHRPELHQGRKRTFPHVEGQYPTTIYIPVQLDAEQQQAVDKLVAALQQLLPDVQPMIDVAAGLQQQRQACNADAKPQHVGSMPQGSSAAISDGHKLLQPSGQHLMGMHVSLSRTVPVRFAMLETLVGLLKDQLASACSSKLALRLEGLRCFMNDEATRTFISIPITAGQQQVVKAIRAVDAAFQVYGLEPYYKDPQPHMSIAWLLGSRRQEVDAAIQQLLRCDDKTARSLPAGHDTVLSSSQCTLQYSVACIRCRAGNREHVVWSSTP